MPKDKTPKIEDLEAPELEIRVSKSWIRLIRWCQVNLPYGQVCVKIKNSEPGDLVEEHTSRSVRFDKEETIPTEYDGMFPKS